MKINIELRHKKIIQAFFLLSVSGCAQQPFDDSPGHLPPVRSSQEQQSAIPKPVLSKPFLPPPAKLHAEQRFSIVVHDVPVRELLFALARDAKVNVDIAPGISGNASLNAIDQTLPQILERLKRQIDIRYQLLDGSLVISVDLPYFVQYSVPYINLSRTSESEVSIATQISSTGTGSAGGASSGGGSGSSNSATNVKTSSSHLFWETLLNNIRAILNNQDSMRGDKGMSEAGNAQTEKSATDGSLIANQESGVIAVKASEKQHREIRKYIDNVVEHASRQVLIEATIVEVALNDDYQTGIDWTFMADNGKFKVEQKFADLVGQAATVAANSTPPTAISYAGKEILASIKMLDKFGNSRVLSSPKLMVLNNQTAVLKVVNNIPYFTTKAEVAAGVLGAPPVKAFTTELHTVPVGLVMNVTPQISDNDTVIINARPTVSRVNGTVNDPNPDLAPILSPIPQIEVREMESILKVNNGDIGVIGGLMQNSVENSTEGTPGLSRVDYLDNLFSFKKRGSKKTELVVFLRPRVIKTASTNGELKDFNTYLENPPVKFDVPELH